ncbi:hypothetical protein [Sandaracinobacteroides saxicola]|uniref:DUF1761 domain-containing protein n=1 Tax=Sandaracinobacteroides saxicola TaxID=2759707 RepID=A0A7G5IEF9_9SPHN|nr:hypothetical protein [Sandaracinobacteroides saxicola]QMW21751.1 hypothetical protein H3309_10080 [Sandaracinobacteroides saxicola]
MIYLWLNAGAILAATVAGLLLGAGWHRLVGRGWVSVAGGVRVAVAQAWFAGILAGALILAPPQAPPLVMAFGSAVVIWAGFVLPVLLVGLPYRGAGVRTAVLDALFWLLLMLVQAGVMKAVGLVAPPV